MWILILINAVFFDSIGSYDNWVRRHSANGWLSSEAFEPKDFKNLEGLLSAILSRISVLIQDNLASIVFSIICRKSTGLICWKAYLKSLCLVQDHTWDCHYACLIKMLDSKNKSSGAAVFSLGKKINFFFQNLRKIYAIRIFEYREFTPSISILKLTYFKWLLLCGNLLLYLSFHCCWLIR